MKIIDGQNAIVGRLASYVAKEALNGETIVIVNCDKAIITGNRASIKEEFAEIRGKIGSGQMGPKVSRNPERIVKRIIRGMMPNYRWGRGKEALTRIKCYVGVPKEFESAKKIVAGKEKTGKFIRVGELSKN